MQHSLDRRACLWAAKAEVLLRTIWKKNMLQRVKRFLWNHFSDKYLFDVRLQENAWREMFFYNAFKALSFNGIDGDYVEFGSCGGRTFRSAYRESRRHKHNAKFWAFDSFQGLPSPKGDKDKHPKWKEGILSTSVEQFHDICAAHDIPRHDYRVVPGFYDETIAGMAQFDQPNNIALAYIDCDLYSSAKTVLEFMMPRLKHGMIIAFDDYFCWSGSAISGERKAQLEFFTEDTPWALERYMQFGWGGLSFVVEDKRLYKK